jgi:hypothetical protein
MNDSPTVNIFESMMKTIPKYQYDLCIFFGVITEYVIYTRKTIPIPRLMTSSISSIY